MAVIRELKSRYKLLYAERKTVSSHDLAFDIPISTGSPTVDSFFLEKISSGRMPSYEHLARSWQLIRNASDGEEEVMLANLRGGLNDHKALLAMKLVLEGDERAEAALKSMPFSWQLGFPLAFIKPGLLFLDGWKADLRFRLAEKFSFSKLRDLYAGILERASDTAILKYRERIHATTALLGYKFETPKEKAIEDWCYGSGSRAGALPRAKLYAEARKALNEGGLKKFAAALRSGGEMLPVTSVMGLLSSKDAILASDATPMALRDYVVDCSTPIEALLRLREWSPWLKDSHYHSISRKVKDANVSSDVPFSKITQAYLAVPKDVRTELTDSVYIPLLKKFGQGIGFLLPKRFSFFQPVNMIQLDNFMLYNVFNVASKGEMVLAGNDDDYRFTFTVDEIRHVVNMERNDAETFLLKKFGGLTSQYGYEYSAANILRGLDKLDRGDLLIINTPFYENLEVVDRLLKWAKVINLSTYYGAPTEISVTYSYDTFLQLGRRVRGHSLRQSPAVYNTVNYLERLYWMEKAAKDVGFDD